MTSTNSWLLPDGVDEVLTPHAERLEVLRRRALDVFQSWGYRLVIPPLIEFLESLLSSEDDLDLQTFKVTDQISGRLMGVRADITPQVARIDAHRLATDYPQRLCYLGPVLHTKPDKFAGSRNPIQIGAELYGHAGVESDAEVMCLLVAVMRVAGIEDLTVELGHMGVFKALVDAAEIDRDGESRLLDALLRKTESELNTALEHAQVSNTLRDQFLALLQLNGDPGIISDVRAAFHHAEPEVQRAIATFVELVELLRERIPEVELHVDLAELRGYHYHTGVTFAAYTGALGRAVAWGGRYDNIGRDFGRPRPATGFSSDLKTLLSISPIVGDEPDRIFAPAGSDPALLEAIESLRTAGQVVVQALPGQRGDAAAMGCARVLEDDNGRWVVREC